MLLSCLVNGLEYFLLLFAEFRIRSDFDLIEFFHEFIQPKDVLYLISSNLFQGANSTWHLIVYALLVSLEGIAQLYLFAVNRAFNLL